MRVINPYWKKRLELHLAANVMDAEFDVTLYAVIVDTPVFQIEEYGKPVILLNVDNAYYPWGIHEGYAEYPLERLPSTTADAVRTFVQHLYDQGYTKDQSDEETLAVYQRVCPAPSQWRFANGQLTRTTHS